VFFANEAGGQVSVGRQEDGTKIFGMTDDFRAGILRRFNASPDGRPGRMLKADGSFDARSQNWYERAKRQSRYWTQSYLGDDDRTLGIALTAPIGSDGNVAGVIGVRVLLSSLADRLNSRCLGYTGRMFIIGPDGELVASSSELSPVAVRAGRDQRRPVATEDADAVVRETAAYLLAHLAASGLLSGPGLQTFNFSGAVLGRTYAAAKGFQVPGAIAWTAVAAIPVSDFLGPAQQALLVSFAISLVVVALTLALGYWLVARSLRPLNTLTRLAQSIARDEWHDVPETQRSDEVGLLARAFRHMTVSLRDTAESLRQREADYRSFFENTIEGILRTTIDGRVLSVNPAAARMFGYASAQDLMSEITNTTEQLWTVPSARSALIARAYSEGDSVSGYEAELKRKDGGRITALLNIRFIRDNDGQTLHIETFATDITERKRAEVALMDARAELAHFARVTTLGEMSASIAHEVTQPLTAASLNAQAGLRWLAHIPANVAEAQQLFEAIVKDTHRAGEVIQRIRALARRAPPERNLLNLNEVIREVAAMMDNEVHRHQIELTLDIEEAIPPVLGDRVQLQQVMINLVINAMEAIDAAGKGRRELTIGSGRHEAGDVLITVRDTGIGLAPDRFIHLFDAFSSTKATGMGMGLRISRTIVEAHDGRLWATANAPRGMVFSFTLPVGDGAELRKASANS
jgi:PAS domain S-box-containing protein